VPTLLWGLYIRSREAGCNYWEKLGPSAKRSERKEGKKEGRKGLKAVL